MKKSLYLVLLASAVLALPSCSKVGGLFDGEEETPLEGERVSVLDMQQNLAADASAPQIVLPAAWVNKAWPMAGGYPNHVMQNLSLDADSLDLSWKTGIGSGSTKELPLNARPVVVGNAIFTMDTGAQISAFDTGSGKRVWRIDASKDKEREDVITGGISFGEDSLFVTNGYDELLSINAQSGDITWRKRLPSPSRAAPTYLDGRVFVTTLDNRLMAFDSKSGENLWEYTGVGEMAGLIGTPSPAANGSTVVPAFSSGEITALRVENGSVAWSDNIASVRQYGGGLESLSSIKAMPALQKGLVVAISFNGKLVAIDEVTGTRVWQREMSGSETPWIAGDFVYVISAENQLMALSLTDGAIVWVANLPKYNDPEDRKGIIRWMGPVMGSGKLVLAGSNGDILTVNATDGKLLSQNKTKQKFSFAPIIAGGTLYLLSDGGTLLAYR